jgi:uncharacterized coiled-coil DUF342 family protein
MANKGLSEKIQDIYEKIVVLQERLEKIVSFIETSTEYWIDKKEFKEKLDERLSSLEDNQKGLDEKLCMKIDDLIDLISLLPKKDKSLTLEDLKLLFKEGEDK